MRIVNPGTKGDFHIHSSTFSDGFNSIDELAIAAGKMGYDKIAITDHSQALLDAYGMTRKTHYDIIRTGRWENIHNDVKVIFGVEADLINTNGDVCDHIQGCKTDFVILSTHKKVFNQDLKDIKTAYLNSIKNYGDRIDILGHFCHKDIIKFMDEDDIIEIIQIANSSNIAVEINCANLFYGKTDLDKLKLVIDYANDVYINSDAHTLNEFYSIRETGFKYLESSKIKL